MRSNTPPAASEHASGGDGSPTAGRSSALSEADQWFRLVLSNEADAILLIDGETGRILEMNGAAIRLYGYTRDELLERTLFDLVVDALPDTELLGLDGGPAPGRIPVRRHCRKNGEVFPAEISAGSSIVNGRRLICKIVRDVSERELTRQALVESERHFRAIADYTYDWESWHGPDGRLIWTNPAVERLTGYTAPECAAMSDYPLPMVDDGDRRRMAELYRSAATGTSGNDVEFRLRRPDGTLCWMAVSWQPIYDHAGAHMGFRTSVRDIAERKQLEERIRRHAEELEVLVEERTAQIRVLEQRRTEVEKLAALGKLAVGVAHEVNNPLAGIRNAFELIKSGLAPEHPYHNYIGLIDAEIERISSIVQQLYQLYRPKPHTVSWIDLGDVTQQVCRLLQSTAHRAGVHLEVQADPDLPPVSLSEGEVKQILYNLLQNALQASHSQQTVTARITHVGDELRVAVTDEGAGIPPDVLPKIFEPFFSTKQTGTAGGMGLGLSVSQGLIAAMGGRIEVGTSRAGTTFTAVFPITFESRPEQTV